MVVNFLGLSWENGYRKGRCMNEIDVLIIGSGSAGQTAAYDLIEAGKKILVVEKSSLAGGVCAMTGCQPKKWFYEAAEAISRCSHLNGKGISRLPKGSWSQVVREKNRFTEGVPGQTVRGFQNAGIGFLQGGARFLDPDTVIVDGQKIRPGYILVATGAKPARLPFPGAEYMMGSDAWMDQTELPEKMVFVGGGFISFEFAHFAARLGPENKRILILEAGDRPLKPFDQETVEFLVRASQEEGIEIHTRVQIQAIERNGLSFRVVCGDGTVHEVDQVVHGAGRVPDIEGLNLDAAGIRYDRGGIVVDSGMRTRNPRVFAAGDCVSTIQLARVGDLEGHTAAWNILSEFGQGKPATMDYDAVPAVLFTYPQLGTVGKTEQALQEEGITYRKSAASSLGWPTYRRVGMKHAAYKILADESGRILGAHFLSDNASGMVNTVRLAMINDIPADRLYLQSILGPYPSRESDLIYMLKPLTDLSS